MVLIKGGDIQPGNNSVIKPNEYKDDNPPTILNDFYINKYNVTIEEWKRFINETGYKTWVWGRFYYGINEVEDSKLSPIGGVYWLDAILFCNWLSEKSKFEKAYEIVRGPSQGNSEVPVVIWHKNKNGFRLPTLEEWQYAFFQRMCNYEEVLSQIGNEWEINKNTNNENDSRGKDKSRIFSTRNVFSNSLGVYFNISQNIFELLWAFGENNEGQTVREKLIDKKNLIDETTDFSIFLPILASQNEVVSLPYNRLTFFNSFRIARNVESPDQTSH
jgi:formylglycine-generating enzyme required for sulfatase activity